MRDLQKNVIEQWSDPNETEDKSDSEHEPEEDHDTEHDSETGVEVCFASTRDIRSVQQEKIIVEGRTFNNYNDFINFMFTQQPDEESESEKREEQLFAIDTEISCKETTRKKGMKEGYDPSQYYAMLSGCIDFDQNIVDDFMRFGPQENMSISEIQEIENFSTTDFKKGNINCDIFFEHISGKGISEEEFRQDDPYYGYIAKEEFSVGGLEDKSEP